MPHHLNHEQTLLSRFFQIVVSGVSASSKFFPTIEALADICQSSFMYFTSSARAKSKMPLVEKKKQSSSTMKVCHTIGEYNGSLYWYS